MIVHDTRNPRAVALHQAVLDRIPRLGDRDDLTVVIGGDGFLLHTVHRFGFDGCYLGLNAGTLGFLLNDVAGRLDEVCAAIKRDQWTEHAFPLLEATVQKADGESVVGHAMNDVYLERMSGQTARLGITIDGYPLVETLSADGLILATALGSTAYSFSAGGNPCKPDLRVMCVTPICPHKPRLAPFVLPFGAVAEIEVQAPDRRPVRAVIDGKDVDYITRVVVGPAERTVCMAYLDGHSFTAQMVGKLLT